MTAWTKLAIGGAAVSVAVAVWVVGLLWSAWVEVVGLAQWLIEAVGT